MGPKSQDQVALSNTVHKGRFLWREIKMKMGSGVKCWLVKTDKNDLLPIRISEG